MAKQKNKTKNSFCKNKKNEKKFDISAVPHFWGKKKTNCEERLKKCSKIFHQNSNFSVVNP